MSKHTPAPWFHDDDGDDRTMYVYVFDRTPAAPIARVDIRHIYSGIHDGRANASLIAAAPDLLEALQAYDAWADKVLCTDDELKRIREQMRAAIAKATGEQQ